MRAGFEMLHEIGRWVGGHEQWTLPRFPQLVRGWKTLIARCTFIIYTCKCVYLYMAKFNPSKVKIYHFCPIQPFLLFFTFVPPHCFNWIGWRPLMGRMFINKFESAHYDYGAWYSLLKCTDILLWAEDLLIMMSITIGTTINLSNDSGDSLSSRKKEVLKHITKIWHILFKTGHPTICCQR